MPKPNQIILVQGSRPPSTVVTNNIQKFVALAAFEVHESWTYPMRYWLRILACFRETEVPSSASALRVVNRYALQHMHTNSHRQHEEERYIPGLQDMTLTWSRKLAATVCTSVLSCLPGTWFTRVKGGT